MGGSSSPACLPAGPFWRVGLAPARRTGGDAFLPADVRHFSPSEFFGYSPAPSASQDADRALNLLVDMRRWNPQPLRLLAHAHALLREGGELIFELDAEEGGSPARCHEKAFYLKALAAHSGFSSDAGAIGNGTGSLQVVLAKTAAARWRFGEFEPEDLPGCLSLFKETFAAEMSTGLWEWKYGEGRGRAIVARRDGRIVAHYGATSRLIAVNGQTVRGLQVCDVMVAPGERALMTKKGAFFEVASAFLEAYFGYHDEHELAFGFPNHRAMRIAERLGLYGEVGRIAELRWTPSDQRSRLGYTTRVLDVSELEDDLLATLWRQMAAEFKDAALVLRDPAYVRYRYQRHPSHRYEALLVRDRLRGRPQGLAILRRENNEYKLLDMLAPLNKIPLLVDAARRQTAHCGLSALTAWISAPYARHLAHGGGVATDTAIRIPANVWTDARSVDRLKDRWWLTMGDTDFL